MLRPIFYFAFVILCGATVLPVGAQSVMNSASQHGGIGKGGPWTSGEAVGIRASRASAHAPLAPMVDRPHAGRDVALMAVGAGAIVGGVLIDNEIGTIFTIGGVVLVLYGLYSYLR